MVPLKRKPGSVLPRSLASRRCEAARDAKSALEGGHDSIDSVSDECEIDLRISVSPLGDATGNSRDDVLQSDSPVIIPPPTPATETRRTPHAVAALTPESGVALTPYSACGAVRGDDSRAEESASASVRADDSSAEDSESVRSVVVKESAVVGTDSAVVGKDSAVVGKDSAVVFESRAVSVENKAVPVKNSAVVVEENPIVENSAAVVENTSAAIEKRAVGGVKKDAVMMTKDVAGNLVVSNSSIALCCRVLRTTTRQGSAFPPAPWQAPLRPRTLSPRAPSAGTQLPTSASGVGKDSVRAQRRFRSSSPLEPSRPGRTVPRIIGLVEDVSQRPPEALDSARSSQKPFDSARTTHGSLNSARSTQPSTTVDSNDGRETADIKHQAKKTANVKQQAVGSQGFRTVYATLVTCSYVHSVF